MRVATLDDRLYFTQVFIVAIQGLLQLIEITLCKQGLMIFCDCQGKAARYEWHFGQALDLQTQTF